MIKNSLIYNGKVVHKRFKPKTHHFKYKVFSLLIDIDELNLIEKEITFFSYNKFNLISFFDKDHGPRNGDSLNKWVKDNLKSIGVNTSEIKIKLLCYPRIFGYVFNPLSIFFIYNKKSELVSIFYEVKNTFGEQHTYIFKTNNENVIQNHCKKKFHVSPFIEMESEYFFKVSKPQMKLSVVINQYDKNGKLLFASQDGAAEKLNSKTLISSFISHPMMTIKIILAIHFEAFKLWTKGIKLVQKKLKILNNITVETK
tara:strand:+ start:153 stop:920 length:768 start_codon:yes stop_codon:yes gene_type:complete